MLMLIRKKGQKVMVDHGAMVVKIIDVKGKQVKLGFEAPQDVVIDREEIFERKRAKHYGIENKLDSSRRVFFKDARDCGFKNILS